MGESFSVHVDQITDELVAAIPEATFKAMEHLREVAVSKTPLESGDLRGSAATTNTTDRHGATVYFAGPYARYQHYVLDLRHEVGQSLYLEQPLVQETPKILDIVATELGRVLD